MTSWLRQWSNLPTLKVFDRRGNLNSLSTWTLCAERRTHPFTLDLLLEKCIPRWHTECCLSLKSCVFFVQVWTVSPCIELLRPLGALSSCDSLWTQVSQSKTTNDCCVFWIVGQIKQWMCVGLRIWASSLWHLGCCVIKVWVLDLVSPSNLHECQSSSVSRDLKGPGPKAAGGPALETPTTGLLGKFLSISAHQYSGGCGSWGPALSSGPQAAAGSVHIFIIGRGGGGAGANPSWHWARGGATTSD